MKVIVFLSFLTLALFPSGCATLESRLKEGQGGRAALHRVSVETLNEEIALDGLLDSFGDQPADRESLLNAVLKSIEFLESPRGAHSFRDSIDTPFSRSEVLRSLARFREILYIAPTAEEIRQIVRSEFEFFRVGNQPGEMLFTGYCEPLFDASRVADGEYRYPLFVKPADFDQWPEPHPSRAQLEGRSGKGEVGSLLRGGELYYLRDRFDVFFIHVQGSAKLQLEDGTIVSVGFDAATKHPFTSIARLLIDDGKMSREEASMTRIRRYFSTHPAELDEYLSRNNRFVFFRQVKGSAPLGSIGVVVTPERSIATDKTLLPPGALAVARFDMPQRLSDGSIGYGRTSRFVLDQDTGSAIRGTSRADFFMGTGHDACERAGVTKSRGDLYYLLLRDRSSAPLVAEVESHSRL